MMGDQLKQMNTENPLATNAFSSIERSNTNDVEVVSILNSQLAERDATIKMMMSQMEDVKRKSFMY